MWCTRASTFEDVQADQDNLLRFQNPRQGKAHLATTNGLRKSLQSSLMKETK